MKPTVAFSLLLFGTVTCAQSVHESNEYQQKTKQIQCSSIFKEVGDHCIFVDESLQGTWYEMREVCNDLGGDLPNLGDANFLADITSYLMQNRLDVADYWVGSNDQITENVWQWVNDNSQVKLGTPLWGDLNDRKQQPTGGSQENCGALLKADHYYMHDKSCTLECALICEDYNQQVIEDASDSMQTMAPTESPTECPYPYTIIADSCLFINTLAATSWHSHKTTCENLGGHMVKLDDANVLGALYDYLSIHGITHNFWIGASDEQQEDNWFWHDSSSVLLGTPFWGDNGSSTQSPDGGVNDNCAIIAYDDHYFFHDTDCEDNEYVICQIDLAQELY